MSARFPMLQLPLVSSVGQPPVLVTIEYHADDVLPSSARDPSVYRRVVCGGRVVSHSLCALPSVALSSFAMMGGVR